MIENDKCPFCGLSAYRSYATDNSCEHYIMGLPHDTDYFDALTPVWISEDFDPIGVSIVGVCDAVFNALKDNPNALSAARKTQDLLHPTSLASLLKSLAKMEEEMDEDYESVFDWIRDWGTGVFLDYLHDVQTEIDGESFSEDSTLTNSPGNSWTTTYFWSRNPKRTAKRMTARINADADLISSIA